MGRRNRLHLGMAIIALGIVLIPAGPACSQKVDSSTYNKRTAHPEPAGVKYSEYKSPGRAVLYSAAGTILLTPILVGPIVGPSFGHFYANASRDAWRGIAIRSGGALVGVTVLITDFATVSHGRTSWEDYVGNAAIIGIVGHAVYDVVTAWHSATEYNSRTGTRVSVVPAEGPGRKQIGLALRATF